MVIGLSGVQLTEWINAKGESDSSIKTMTKFEFETWHRLYTFINLKTTTTTGRSWISTRRNAQQQHAHTALICPTTLSKYKHGAFTVLLVLKSGRWQPIMFENFVIVLIMFVNPLLKQSSQTFLLITQSCSSNNNTLNWLANNSWKSKARNECSQARSVPQKGFESLLLLQSSIKKNSLTTT